MKSSICNWLSEVSTGRLEFIPLPEPALKPKESPTFGKVFGSSSVHHAAQSPDLAERLASLAGLERHPSFEMVIETTRRAIDELIGDISLLPRNTRFIALAASLSTDLSILAQERQLDVSNITFPDTDFWVGERQATFVFDKWRSVYNVQNPSAWHIDDASLKLGMVHTFTSLKPRSDQNRRPLYDCTCQTFGLAPEGTDDYQTRSGRFPGEMRFRAPLQGDLSSGTFKLHPLIYIGLVVPIIDSAKKIRSAHLFDIYHGHHPESGKLVTVRAGRSRFEKYFGVAGDDIWIPQ